MMTKCNVTDEQVLNEIFIAYVHANDFCDPPSKELIHNLAQKFQYTELVLQKHFDYISTLYRKGDLDKKELTPHRITEET